MGKGRHAREEEKTLSHTHSDSYSQIGTRMKQKERMGEVRTVEAHDKTQLVHDRIITAPFSFTLTHLPRPFLYQDMGTRLSARITT